MREAVFGILQKSSSHARPNAMAWAIVLGCLVGLLPKTSLLVVLGVLIAFFLPIHIFLFGLCFLTAASIAPLVHPLLGNLGHLLLQTDWIRANVHAIEQYPLAAWLKLHNTTVAGSVCFSTITALPLTWLVELLLRGPFLQWMVHQQSIASGVLLPSIDKQATTPAFRLDQPKSDGEISNSHQPVAQRPLGLEPKPLLATLAQIESNIYQTVDRATTTAPEHNSAVTHAIDSIHALEDLLEQAHSDRDDQTNAVATLARATKASTLVEDILRSLDQLAVLDWQSQESEAAEVNTLPSSYRIDSPQLFHAHQTTISIHHRSQTDGFRSSQDHSANTFIEKDVMSNGKVHVGSQAISTPRDTARASAQNMPILGGANLTAQPTSPQELAQHLVQPAHEEALRHLLSHLRTIRETV